MTTNFVKLVKMRSAKNWRLVLSFISFRRFYRDISASRAWIQPLGPGNSPDINPIENLWSQMSYGWGLKPDLQSKVRETSKAGIQKLARKVWRAITPDYLKRLYESMPQRMAAVIDAQGGHTKY